MQSLFVIRYNKKYNSYRVFRDSCGLYGVSLQEAIALADRLERGKNGLS